MNHVVANELLSVELANYLELPYEELAHHVGAPIARRINREGVDYDVTTTLRRLKKTGGDIELKIQVCLADWGSPHDPVSETAVIKRGSAMELKLKGKPATEKQFWGFLEYRIDLEFRHMTDGRLNRYWCDGIAPAEYYVNACPPCIHGFAWICDDRRQEEWRFEFLLPNPVDRPEDIDWTSLLPADNVTCWLAVDTDRKFIQIEPAAAVPDLI